jgi:ferredoxin
MEQQHQDQEEIKEPENLPEELSQGTRKEGKIRRVVVDREACIGARSCVVVAEAAFQMDDENLAYVTDTMDEVDEETLRLAAEACPVFAIHLFDKEGKKLFPEE